MQSGEVHKQADTVCNQGRCTSVSSPWSKRNKILDPSREVYIQMYIEVDTLQHGSLEATKYRGGIRTDDTRE